MKATLHSRKNSRLKWFELANIPFRVERKLEVTYNTSSVESNLHTHTPTFEYVFTEVTKDLPSSEIIIFENQLPTAYARTNGTRGSKFSTQPQPDPILAVKDRIVELTQGKESIKREPPEYPDPRIKEVEIRERTDDIKRKLAFVNESPESIDHMTFKFIATKEVRFISATPAPTTTEPPEYSWTFVIPPEGTYSIELDLKTFVRKTFNIEREVEPKPKTNARPRVQRQFNERLNL